MAGSLRTRLDIWRSRECSYSASPVHCNHEMVRSRAACFPHPWKPELLPKLHSVGVVHKLDLILITYCFFEYLCCELSVS